MAIINQAYGQVIQPVQPIDIPIFNDLPKTEQVYDYQSNPISEIETIKNFFQRVHKKYSSINIENIEKLVKKVLEQEDLAFMNFIKEETLLKDSLLNRVFEVKTSLGVVFQELGYSLENPNRKLLSKETFEKADEEAIRLLQKAFKEFNVFQKKKEIKEPVRSSKLADDQGNAAAQYNLGICNKKREAGSMSSSTSSSFSTSKSNSPTTTSSTISSSTTKTRSILPITSSTTSSSKTSAVLPNTISSFSTSKSNLPTMTSSTISPSTTKTRSILPITSSTTGSSKTSTIFSNLTSSFFKSTNHLSTTTYSNNSIITFTPSFLKNWLDCIITGLFIGCSDYLLLSCLKNRGESEIKIEPITDEESFKLLVETEFKKGFDDKKLEIKRLEEFVKTEFKKRFDDEKLKIRRIITDEIAQSKTDEEYLIKAILNSENFKNELTKSIDERVRKIEEFKDFIDLEISNIKKELQELKDKNGILYKKYEKKKNLLEEKRKLYDNASVRMFYITIQSLFEAKIISIILLNACLLERVETKKEKVAQFAGDMFGAVLENIPFVGSVIGNIATDILSTAKAGRF